MLKSLANPIVTNQLAGNNYAPIDQLERSDNRIDMCTFLKDGMEFVLPGILKAYPRDWANQLLNDGNIYFTNWEVFRRDKDPKRGDRMEGTGATKRDGKRYETNYGNPIFIWSSTMETNPKVILETWRDRDTVIQITNTLKFAERIRDVAVAQKTGIINFQIGPVTYDKDEGSHRDSHWAEGVFQKNYCYSRQKEFRFALIGNYDLKNEEHVMLPLGNCQDVARLR